MKRAEKITFLTKLLQEGTSQTNRQRLQQVIETAPRSLILIDDLDEPDKPITNNDTISFQDRGVQHRMTLGQAQLYARRYRVHTLFVLPAKRKA